jgi:hypothetical protein
MIVVDKLHIRPVAAILVHHLAFVFEKAYIGLLLHQIFDPGVLCV